MSLRDQLLATGIANKKNTRRVAAQERKERTRRKGTEKKRGEVEREARVAAEQAERDRALAVREQAAKTRVALQALEVQHELHMLVETHRVGRRGRVPFHHKALDGVHLRKIWIDEATARRLRGGQLAIGGYLRRDGTARYAIITANAASALTERRPQMVVFWDRTELDATDPSLAAGTVVGEPSLRPHRMS